LPPHRLSLRRIGTGCAVRQLDQRHDREGHRFTRCPPAISLRTCRALLLPFRSAAINTLESSISPVRKGSAARDA
jgi:hypothetical protein